MNKFLENDNSKLHAYGNVTLYKGWLTKPDKYIWHSLHLDLILYSLIFDTIFKNLRFIYLLTLL